LGVSRAAVSKAMTAYTNHGTTSSDNRNSGRKTNTGARDGGRLCLKIKTIAAKVTAELNIHLVDPVSTYTLRRGLHKSHIHGTTAIAKPLITENNTKRRKKMV
jgi:hypothetical protein